MKVDWTTFKNFVTDRKLSVQYIDLHGHYFLKAIDNPFELTHVMRKDSPASSDQTDFENNFQGNGNKIVNIPKRFGTEIQRNNVDKFSSVNKFGVSSTIGSSKAEIWDSSGRYTFLSSAETLRVVSTSADDTSAGTGAQKIKIQGLDSSWALQEEEVSLNGTTAVTTTNSFIRTFRAFVTKAGTKDVNAGDITISSSTSSKTQAVIKNGNNQALMSIYTIPVASTGYLTDYYVSVPKSRETESILEIREPDGVFKLEHQVFTVEQSFEYKFEFPVKIPAKSDIIITSRSLDGVTANVSGGFDLIVVDRVE